MLFGIGLPRMGGQTLQCALSILTHKTVWHSIEPGRWHDSIQPEDGGAVEMYAPLNWLVNYPGGPHTLIYNVREIDSWFASCEKVYQYAQAKNWNHPLWRYPLSQFRDYWDEWNDRIDDWYCKFGGVKCVNVVENPSWGPLCQILNVPIPDQPFPNVDHTRTPLPVQRFDDFFGISEMTDFEV